MPTSAVAPPVVTAAPRPPGTTASGGTVSATTRKIQIATTRARSALRRVFGTQLHGLRMACRLRTGGTAACNVTFTKRGARYTGKVYVRTKTVNKKLRWQYRVDVTKRKSGKTTHVRRDYRTGGLAG
jgi:hypothetical protein